MTRVGIDLRILHYAKTGFHRYAQGLLRSVQRFRDPDTRLILFRHAAESAPEPVSAHGGDVVLATPLFHTDEGDALRRELEPLDLDVIHFPFSLFPGRVAPRVVLTIHDLTCVRFPQFIEPRYLPFYLDAVRRAGDADRISVVSGRVRDDLVQSGLPPKKIGLAYPLTPFEDDTALGHAAAVDQALIDRLDGHPYLLSVGSLEPRKNHEATLEAFSRLRARTPERLRLLLVGHHGWLMESLAHALQRNPYREDVWLVRNANDATLRHLLRHCRLFVNLSVYEGFGLPVLEALAHGACVLSTPIPSLVESGFPPEGILETTDADAVAARLARLLADAEARTALAARSRAVVGAFYRACDPARLAQLYRW
jgi:glycosyltransferase involved in cell wall biosynthesis